MRQALGIRTPIIREGDNLKQIVIDSLFKVTEIQDGDIIGITESVVARAEGNYVTIDEIVSEIKRLNKQNLPIQLINPIYSRNRFAMILKAFARSTSKLRIIMPDYDEVGNPSTDHPFTKVNYKQYYRQIVEAENCVCEITETLHYLDLEGWFNVDCSLHKPIDEPTDTFIGLNNIFSSKCKYGLLGSNKASEEKLKLFPNNGQQLVDEIQEFFKNKGIHVECMIYGDGCFKDPIGGIWEFADPVTSPAYTSGLEGYPSEIKLKAFADDKYKDLSGKSLEEAIIQEIKSKQSSTGMDKQGTTPRRKIDLLVSLMDLISGSGDVGTPVVLVRDYNLNFAN